MTKTTFTPGSGLATSTLQDLGLRRTDGREAAKAAAVALTSPAKTKTDQPTAAAAQSTKTSLAQAALSKSLTAVAAEIQALLAKAKTPLEGELRFTANGQGGVTVYASARDRATLTAAMKGDKSRPSLAARLTSLTKEAQTLATTMNQQSTFVRAAHSASRPGNVMSLYTALLQQDAQGASASLNISNTSSSVSYAGPLQLKA